MFSHEFMRSAYLAGSFIALGCGLVGYFVVLRSQVFAGDALSHVAFAGALGAAVVGWDTRIGLFVSTLLVAAVIAGLGGRARADDVVIGSVFAWVLGLGALGLSILSSGSGGRSATRAGTQGVAILFGSIFGLSGSEAELAAAIAAFVCLAVLVLGRPLLFSTLDADVARARGLRVGLIGVAFLVVVGLITAEATQAVGALLLLGLLAAPAGAAQQLTSRAYGGLALSGALALASMWLGLALAYAVPSLPPSTAIVAVAVLAYAASAGWRAWRMRAARAPSARDRPARIA